MRKGHNGEKSGGKEKTVDFSGHYSIASSRPPEHRLLERRTLVPIKLIWSSLPLFRNVRCFFISDSSWSSLLSPLGKYWKHFPSYNLFHFLNYLPGITRRTIIYRKSVGNFLQCVKAINLLKVKNVHYWLPSSYQPFFNSSIRKPVF